MTAGARAATLLPLAALVAIVGASIVGYSHQDAEGADSGAPATDPLIDPSTVPPDGPLQRPDETEEAQETDGTDEPWDPAPPVTDLDAERDALLAGGRAVDAGGLDPGLEAALERARAAAAADGVELTVGSGHRSAEEQLTTLVQEVERRGTLDEALRWVFRPDRSMHVRGLAIDLDSGPAADWVVAHGDRFGLCRTLVWEWWHVEWRQRWEDAASCPTPATSPEEAPAP